MRLTFSVLGWLVKFAIGLYFASQNALALSSPFTLVAFGLIGAIGLHVLANVMTDEQAAVPPRSIVVGLTIAIGLALLTSTVVYAQPMAGCQTCLDNGNSWWWCFFVYGVYCL